MSKLTRRQKKEEEQRIIAEMEQALREARGETAAEEETQTEVSGGEQITEQSEDTRSKEQKKKDKKSVYHESMPEKIHCRRCHTLMEQGVCPTCGYKVYVPMDKKKQDKVRLIVALVCMIAFVILFVALQIQKS